MTETPLGRFLRGHVCPYYQRMPGSDDDLVMLAPRWTNCDYEGACEDEDQCPILPPERRYPELKEEEGHD